MRHRTIIAVQMLTVAVLAGVLLAGCAPAPPPVQTRTIEERVTVPKALLTCAPAPVLGVVKTQKDVGDFIIRLDAAGEDCRDTVASIAAIEAEPAGK